MEYWSLELSEFASVRAFADRFEKDGGDLDILVANAAVATYDFVLTSDGYDNAYVFLVLRDSGRALTIVCQSSSEPSIKFPSYTALTLTPREDGSEEWHRVQGCHCN